MLGWSVEFEGAWKNGARRWSILLCKCGMFSYCWMIFLNLYSGFYTGEGGEDVFEQCLGACPHYDSKALNPMRSSAAVRFRLRVRIMIKALSPEAYSPLWGIWGSYYDIP